jgi:DNA-binding winged helix-turn-helix (wHTH) protein
MAVAPRSATPFVFGPFEVDASAPALLKHEVRIRLAGQPLRILLVLLEHPRELITRDQLCHEVWGVEPSSISSVA